MTLHINKLIILILLGTLSYADKVEYKHIGKYKMVSAKHLINDIAYKKNNLYQILVEIPTGSRQKWEVNHKTGDIEWEFQDGKPREVQFLGYPGNYGFIPQTRSGDGDPLDIILLSESVNRGDILKVQIIGMIKLEDNREEDTKIVALNANSIFKNINTIKDMLLKYPNVIPIIKEWFEGYKGSGHMLFKGYKGRKSAIEHIEKAHKQWIKELNITQLM